MTGGRNGWFDQLHVVVVPLFVLICELASAKAAPISRDQWDRFISGRVETMAILSTNNTFSDGLYQFRGEHADLNATQFPFDADLESRYGLGQTELTWTPAVIGGIGYATFDDSFNGTPLAGNHSTVNTYGFSLGGGPRVFLTPHWSVLPAFALIYAHTNDDFDAHTSSGLQLQHLAGGATGWTADTLTIVPSFQLRYRQIFGRWTPTFTSQFEYFQTFPLNRTTDAISFQSDSIAWRNTFDLEYHSDVRLFNCPLNPGIDLSRADLFGQMRTATRTDDFYEIGVRVMADISAIFPPLDQLGVRLSYLWSDHTDGYSVSIIFTF